MKILNAKKSQITFFMIFGIILLGGIVLFFFMKNNSSKEALTASTLTASQAKAKLAPINDRIQSCLDGSLSDGIYLLGVQGGYIFKDQPGSVVPWTQPRLEFYADNMSSGAKKYNISYLISNDPKDITPENSAVFLSNPYPCRTCIVSTGSAGYGTVPLFCEYTSDKYTCIYGKTSLQVIEGRAFSLTDQLQTYVVNKTRNCLNFTDLEDKGYKIKTDFSSYNLTIASKSVEARLVIYINASLGEIMLPAGNQTYTSSKNVRLGELYSALKNSNYGLITLDTTNIDFDIFSDGTNMLSKNMNKPFTVKVIRNVKGQDDIIRVTDTSSNLNGASYMFQFARQNRPPTLDLVKDIPIYPDYDYVVVQGAPLRIDPQGYDPDEDTLNYSYSGWRGSDWTSSTLFTATKQSAQIILNPSDVGAHNITVFVSDGQYKDWQTVRILVLPMVKNYCSVFAGAYAPDYKSFLERKADFCNLVVQRAADDWSRSSANSGKNAYTKLDSKGFKIYISSTTGGSCAAPYFTQSGNTFSIKNGAVTCGATYVKESDVNNQLNAPIYAQAMTTLNS